MVLVVLVVGILATGAAVQSAGRSRQRLATLAMDRNIEDIGEVIAGQVSQYGDALTDLAAGISAQERLTHADFDAMTASLNSQRLKGASGVAFVVPAYDRQVPAAEAHWRASGAAGLSLHRTGTDVQHEFVVFTRAFTGTTQPPGRDLSQTPETEETLRIARETSAFSVGPAHVLLRDRMLPAAEQQMSFTLAVPVYGRPGTAASRTVAGWVAMGIRGGDFLSQTLHNEAQGAIQIVLEDPSGDSTVIAAVTSGTAWRDDRLARARTVLVGQHTWHLTIRPTTALLSAADRRSTAMTLLVGVIVTVLLATLVGVLTGARARAMDRVDEATAALRQDIRRREALEKELQRLAFHDPLTGLANRSLFCDRVDQALRTHARGDESFAVFFIDLDGFKQVNDELGHAAGDRVLCEVAERLRAGLRDGDTVARFGGDEFAVLLERLPGPDHAHLTAERIVAAVQHPIDVGRTDTAVTASVGVALNRTGETADDILREADLAMYTAKTTGKGRHVLAGTV
jgi:diguanylate cyclase (GGDEF)-like protein